MMNASAGLKKSGPPMDDLDLLRIWACSQWRVLKIRPHYLDGVDYALCSHPRWATPPGWRYFHMGSSADELVRILETSYPSHIK